MKDIKRLQNIKLDKGKLASILKDEDRDTIKDVLGVRNSQLAYLRKGEKGPSVDGLLRLMVMYGLDPSDLITGQ